MNIRWVSLGIIVLLVLGSAGIFWLGRELTLLGTDLSVLQNRPSTGAVPAASNVSPEQALTRQAATVMPDTIDQATLAQANAALADNKKLLEEIRHTTPSAVSPELEKSINAEMAWNTFQQDFFQLTHQPQPLSPEQKDQLLGRLQEFERNNQVSREMSAEMVKTINGR